MMPSVVTNQKRRKMHTSICAKKLNQSIVVNTRLRKRIAVLSAQNKQLSYTLNNLLLHKLTIENEINSVKNENIELKPMIYGFYKKFDLLKQTLQTCLPALVTLSNCIENMMGNVQEITKSDKLVEFKKTEKPEKQTRSVRPMINGMTIKQPAVTIKRLDMSPIIESPHSEQSPKQLRKSSCRSSPQSKLSLEPYVRLKDVAVLLKNSKSVPNKDAPKHQFNDNLGEGPSWLHEPQIVDNNTSVTEKYENSQVPSNISTRVIETTLTINEVETNDMSVSTSSLNGNISKNMFNETEIGHVSLTSTDPSMLKNITHRRPLKRRSSETSVVSDIDISSTSSTRSRRSKKTINYQEPTLNTKLRRN